MGGRGARFGNEKSKQTGVEKDVPYGSTYNTVAEFGNYKVVIGNPDGNGRYNATPMESQTPNRRYVYLRQNEEFASIVHIGEDGKRVKQIDMPHIGEPKIHVHHGYWHNEFSSDNKPQKPSKTELNEIKYIKRKLKELRIGV